VEPRSLFTGESQPGQVTLHRTRQWPMLPSQIRSRWFQASFLGNPWRENPDSLVLAHTEGREGNLLIGTQIRSLRMPGLLDGALDALAADHPLCPFIPSSGCSGGSDPIGGFHL
jgi:hypothetical protein